MFESLKNFSNKSNELVTGYETGEIESDHSTGIKVGFTPGYTTVTISNRTTQITCFLDEQDVKRLVKMLEATL